MFGNTFVEKERWLATRLNENFFQGHSEDCFVLANSVDPHGMPCYAVLCDISSGYSLFAYFHIWESVE